MQQNASSRASVLGNIAKDLSGIVRRVILPHDDEIRKVEVVIVIDPRAGIIHGAKCACWAMRRTGAAELLSRKIRPVRHVFHVSCACPRFLVGDLIEEYSVHVNVSINVCVPASPAGDI